MALPSKPSNNPSLTWLTLGLLLPFLELSISNLLVALFSCDFRDLQVTGQLAAFLISEIFLNDARLVLGALIAHQKLPPFIDLGFLDAFFAFCTFSFQQI